MATTTGTHVNFVKVPSMAKFNDITTKADGTIYFIVDEKKIHLDGVMYGFNDSDVADQFLELVGGTIDGDLQVNGELYATDILTENIIFDYGNVARISSQDGYLSFITNTEGAPDQNTKWLGISDLEVNFDGRKLKGVAHPVDADDAVNLEYLENNVLHNKGAAGGFASLGTDGKVPSTQLPSYVDDVVEYSAKASFPATGESGKLYVDLSNNKVWRWSGSAYVNVSDGNAHLTLGTTESTAYNGKDGLTAYEHSRLTSGNPHGVTKANVGLGSVENYGIATKTDAEAGAIGNKYMTPIRTKEAIEKLAPKLAWTVVA